MYNARQYECEECRMLKRFRNLHKYKNTFLCWKCYARHFHKINLPGKRKCVTLDEALERTYKVRGYKHKITGQIQATLGLPRVLAGRKIKVILDE